MADNQLKQFASRRNAAVYTLVGDTFGIEERFVEPQQTLTEVFQPLSRHIRIRAH